MEAAKSEPRIKPIKPVEVRSLFKRVFLTGLFWVIFTFSIFGFGLVSNVFLKKELIFENMNPKIFSTNLNGRNKMKNINLKKFLTRKNIAFIRKRNISKIFKTLINRKRRILKNGFPIEIKTDEREYETPRE